MTLCMRVRLREERLKGLNSWRHRDGQGARAAASQAWLLPCRNLLNLLKGPGHGQVGDPGEEKKTIHTPRCPPATRLPTPPWGQACWSPKDTYDPASLLPTVSPNREGRGWPVSSPEAWGERAPGSAGRRAGWAALGLTSGPPASRHPGRDGSCSWQDCSWEGPGVCGGRRERAGWLPGRKRCHPPGNTD